MNDLYTAIGVMSIVCLLTALVAHRFLSTDKGQTTMLCLTLSVLAAVMFQFYGSGQLIWARWIPSSAAVIYTNFAAIFAAFAAGWASRLPRTPLWRRMILSLGLGLMSLTAITWPLLSIAVRPAPEGGVQWNDGVAMQTSWATCSPAAAATLLRAEGIDATEAELIPLCLTDSAGTPTLGMYRGLKLMAKRGGRDAVVVSESTTEMLAKNDWPILLAVELPFGVDDRRYADQWGWIPGMGHSVVALGRTPDGRILIGDPSVGLEAWTEDDLRLLWHGDGIRIQ